ncbi:hypothetical protein GGR52DRAFT_589114 [Hypoxylon sp. FL1284]|nr:hypothetical protein GGR52DRAFT_589114 [Hypoxylon sp. FL1284]
MTRSRSGTHGTMMETSRRPSLWNGSLWRDHIRLDDLPADGSYDQAKSRPSTRSRSFAWPFHRRNPSERPSTARSSRFTLRTWQPSNLFRQQDDTASIDRSIIPDYVVNYIRGETPETVARRNERKKWGQHEVRVTPRRGTIASHPIQFGHFYAASNSDISEEREDHDLTQRGAIRRLTTGWRGGIIFNSLISFLILLVGIICLIIVTTKTNLLSGSMAVFSGDCAKAEQINIGIHVVINVFSVSILAGANYVFQVLSSPTRREVAVAHEKKRWLDIGVPSVRNFAHISGLRTALAIFLLLGAVATQVIYNAVIFTTQDVVNFDVLFVTRSFLDHAPFDSSPKTNDVGFSDSYIASLQDASSQDDVFTDMDSATCLQELSGSFQHTFDAILLITDSVSTTSSLIHASKSGPSFTTPFTSQTDGITAPDGSLVQRCLALGGAAPPTCSVSASGLVLWVAVLLNLVTLIGMMLILARSSFEPLATVGDAVRSFLRNPDPTTANACLLAKPDVRAGVWALGEARSFAPRHHYWLQTPSPARWALAGLAWLAAAVPAAVALGLLFSSQMPADQALTPFGTAAPRLTLVPPAPLARAPTALIAALPQALLAVLYFVANAHLTAYFLSDEFSRFARGPLPLRVSSSPAGDQATSLFLTLPRPASWALLLWFAAAGLVLSQAVFPGVAAFSSVPAPSGAAPARLVGFSFSTLGLLVLLALLGLLALVVLGLGARRAPAASLASGEDRGNPLVLRGGACSAVVSSRCHNHRYHGDGAELWLRPVAWGVVEEGRGSRPGRCGFSADSVGSVDAGKSYV